MKKINKLFIFVFTLFVAFIGFNKVEAYNCMYRALDSTAVDADHEYYLTYDFTPTTTWGRFLSSTGSSVAGNTKGFASKLKWFVADIDSAELLSTNTNECYTYMYFRDNKSGDYYFSNMKQTSSGYDDKYCDGKRCYNIYRSVNNYSKLDEGVELLDFTSDDRTPDNTEINDMMCTYRIKDIKKDLPLTIVLSISKEENGTYSYSIYEDALDMTSTFYNTTGRKYLTDVEISSLRSAKTGQYGCPSGVKMTYSKDKHFFGNVDFEFTINYDDPANEGKNEGTYDYDFVPTASFITYHNITGTSGTLGKWFNYKLAEDESDKTYFSIAQYKVSGEDTQYQITWGYDVSSVVDLSKVTLHFDFLKEHFYGDENDLDAIYTNCFNTKKSECYFADYPGFQILVSDPEDLVYMEKYVSQAEKDDVDLDEAEIVLDLDIRLLYGAIKSPLSKLNSLALNYNIKIGGRQTTFNTVEANDNVCYADVKYRLLPDYCGDLPDDKVRLENYLIKAMNEMYSHCTEIYENAGKSNNDAVEDCDAFYEFYQQLVNDGIISAGGAGCEMLSTDFSAKLKRTLDILKIMGPIVAIALGTLDFVRAIASGDADKEMKSAFKRLLTRLIAAALLFIIPFILAVLMDIFLKNKEGYNTDNPFCNIVDWNK